jgi:antitoxin (DNA-binding transcriptional repressor) of toxin-antitoxin stability system
MFQYSNCSVDYGTGLARRQRFSRSPLGFVARGGEPVAKLVPLERRRVLPRNQRLQITAVRRGTDGELCETMATEAEVASTMPGDGDAVGSHARDRLAMRT